MKDSNGKSYLGDSSKERKNKILVNLITSIRSLGSAAIVPIFLNGGAFKTGIAAILFFATDFIDGFLARKLHVQSFFGCLLDAVSDKVFGIVCLILLGTLNPVFLAIPAIELGIFAVNYKSIQKGNNVKSSILGKVKTVLLATSIVGGFFSYATPDIKEILNYLNVTSLDTLLSQDPKLLSSILAVPTIAASLYVEKDYLSKAHKQDVYRDKVLTNEAKKELNDNYTLSELQLKKEELIRRKQELLELKSSEEIKHDLFNTEFYLEHRDDSIKRLLYKNKGSE